MAGFKTGDAAKKKQTVIAIAAVAGFLGLLVLGMYLSDPNAGKPSALEIAKEKAKEAKNNFRASSGASAEESWVSMSEKRFASLQQENAQLKRSLIEMNKKLDALADTGMSSRGTIVRKSEKSTDDNTPKLPGFKPAPQPASVTQATPVKTSNPPQVTRPGEAIATKLLPPPPSATGTQYGVNRNGGGNGQSVSTISVVSLEDDTKKNGDKKAKAKHISHYLPAGSFAKVVLMNGINAPTGGQAAQNPVPVLMRVIDNGQMPNRFRSAIKNCHVTGAATGDIASEIAHVRLEKLTCILINGDVITSNVKGYVAGESGAAGFRGKLIERTGSLLAKTLFAGIAGGFGKNIQQQYQSVSTSALGAITTMDPDNAAQAGLAGGVSNSMEMLAQYYMDRANEIYPIIEVGSKRIGELVLLEGVDFERNLLENAANE